MNCCLRASLQACWEQLHFQRLPSTYMILIYTWISLKKCHESKEVQIICGKRKERKEGKTNEMEIKAFYQQKCGVVFLRELLIFNGVAFLFI